MTKKTNSKQKILVLEELTEDEKVWLQKVEQARLKARWNGIGILLLFILEGYLMMTMSAHHVLERDAHAFNVYSMPFLWLYLVFNVFFYIRELRKADKAYPGWRKAMKGSTFLGTGAQVTIMLVILVVGGIIAGIFNHYYYPNTAPDYLTFISIEK